MIRKNDGFTLVELMITMVIFVLAIAAASQMFSGILTQFKQQSKIAETNIEGITGLELLRFDIEQAGYGLPWSVDANGDGIADADWTQLTAYCEATAATPANFNDGTSATCPAGAASGNAPRAIVIGNNTVVNGSVSSDYLVIKSINVATNSASRKWTYVTNSGASNSFMTAWGSQEEDLNNDSGGVTDRVIVILPTQGNNRRILLTNSNAFFAQFNTAVATFGTAYPSFVPMNYTYKTHLIYGVDTDTNLAVPFNRADYYIVTTAGTVPAHCAPGTGVLVKSVFRHSDRTMGAGLPLLDCVADMQIIFVADVNGDGFPDTARDELTGLTAAQIRTIKEVRIYILLHEGQRDTTYSSATTITATDPEFGTVISYAVPDVHYRWKVYSMVVTPYNLR